jgi:hypothetical protein
MRMTKAVTRRAVLFAFGAALGKLDILTAQPAKQMGRGPGQLTVDLGLWGGIIFKHKGKTVTVSMDEVMDALAPANPRS